MHCAAFQLSAYVLGLVCRWNCTLVHADSGAIVSAYVDSCSGPSMLMCRSSPRAAKICSFSRAYRGLALSESMFRCSGVSVGRMPIMTMCAPTPRERFSASFRSARSSTSSSANDSPARPRGGTLISMLN